MVRTRPRLRPFAGALLVAVLGGASLGACQSAGFVNTTAAPSPPLLPTASPGPTAAGTDVGTITLTDEECTWEANPGSVAEGQLTLTVRNQTDDHGVFLVHKLRAGKTFDEGRAAIAAIQEALKTGAEWPQEVSDVISEATAEAGDDSAVTVEATAGTLGVVCSANTSPTGDILTVYLVGPLEVTGP